MSQPVIKVDRLTKRFDDTAAVDAISFAVPAGTVAGLLGGNGAGKTTTISMLLGLLLPTSGTIEVLGVDMLRHRHRVLPRMNFSSPYVDLPHRLTVAENLTVYGHLYGLSRRPEPGRGDRGGAGYRAVPQAPGRQPVGRAEDPRGPCQGAAQQARRAAAGRADRLARSRHGEKHVDLGIAAVAQ